uniref:Uncharacterized protein n=1 Tax=Salix viminalis TaxID=40686 RepID=A0A6N2LVY0_SALVM
MGLILIHCYDGGTLLSLAILPPSKVVRDDAQVAHTLSTPSSTEAWRLEKGIFRIGIVAALGTAIWAGGLAKQICWILQGVQSAGAAVAWQVDAHKVPLLTQLIHNVVVPELEDIVCPAASSTFVVDDDLACKIHITGLNT